MAQLPVSLYTSQGVKQLDEIAISQQKEAGSSLMKRAGQAAFKLIQNQWPKARKLVVFCGSGNNGGDGFVVARLAKTEGFEVSVIQVGDVDASRLSPEAKEARDAWLALKQPIHSFREIDKDVDVIIDAMLGTGLKFPLKASYQVAINAINQAKSKNRSNVLAIDLPSGLDGNTGDTPDVVIQADMTITFIGLKIGLFCANAYQVVGKLFFDHLGVDTNGQMRVQPVAKRFDYGDITDVFSKNRSVQHKGDNGHVLVIGAGEVQYAGAPLLSAEAAYRSGAGLVTVCVEPKTLPLMARAIPEIMIHPLDRLKELEELVAKADVILIGPGLGQNKWSKNVLEKALSSGKQLVVDADALNILSTLSQVKNTNWILTPHPGEAGRLLKQTTKEIQADRLQAAIKLQQQYHGTIVLKGQGTIICSAKALPMLYSESIPLLATAGTGDVLAGLIAGLWAQKLSPERAAQFAVAVHGQAAREEQILGDKGMVASDLFLHIRSLLSLDKDEH